jgi:four helix bundle protein
MAVYKFENLEVWKISLDLTDKIYELSLHLPDLEKFNLVSQIIRASTSVSLNIAEGSTSSSNAEQIRFLKIAKRSLIEVVACLRLIGRRKYLMNTILSQETEKIIDILYPKLCAFIKSLSNKKSS